MVSSLKEVHEEIMKVVVFNWNMVLFLNNGHWPNYWLDLWEGIFIGKIENLNIYYYSNIYFLFLIFIDYFGRCLITNLTQIFVVRENDYNDTILIRTIVRVWALCERTFVAVLTPLDSNSETKYTINAIQWWNFFLIYYKSWAHENTIENVFGIYDTYHCHDFELHYRHV